MRQDVCPQCGKSIDPGTGVLCCLDEDDDSRTHLYVTVHLECLDQYAEALKKARCPI